MTSDENSGGSAGHSRLTWWHVVLALFVFDLVGTVSMSGEVREGKIVNYNVFYLSLFALICVMRFIEIGPKSLKKEASDGYEVTFRDRICVAALVLIFGAVLVGFVLR